MPVADLVDEWFESELLRATVAAPGISGTMLGPRSAGSTLVMLLREAHATLAKRRTLRARGGPGAVTRALAAAAVAAGAEVRTDTPVERILVNDNRAVGVVVAGREIPAETVVSGADPRTTFLGLVEPGTLEPDFAQRMRNYRAKGSLAKLNWRCRRCPRSATPAPIPERSAAASTSGRRWTTWSTRSTAPSTASCQPSRGWTCRFPRSSIPACRRGRARRIDLRPLRPGASRGQTRGSAPAPPLERSALDVLDRYAPGIRGLIVAAQLITPEQTRDGVRLCRGPHLPRRAGAGSALLDAAAARLTERYATPIQGLFLCGAGTHPGGFMTGASGRLAAAEVLRARIENLTTRCQPWRAGAVYTAKQPAVLPRCRGCTTV
jgi:phytoene dehydrogenase-like protein